jgi:hypothetical protein
MTDRGLAGKSSLPTVVSGPLTMLFLCICGMAIGLAIDCGALPPEALASLCLAPLGSLADGLLTHLELLPATHALMLIGALVAAAISEAETDEPRRRLSIAARTARHLHGAICVVAMAGGMMLGGFLGPPMIGRLGVASGFTQLAAAMLLGMAAGMLLTMPFHRLRGVAGWRDRSDGPEAGSAAH